MTVSRTSILVLRSKCKGKVKVDYFAVSLPDMLIWEDDLKKRNQLFCKYLIGLGEFGLGNSADAQDAFEQILESDRYYAGAHIHLRLLKKMGEKV